MDLLFSDALSCGFQGWDDHMPNVIDQDYFLAVWLRLFSKVIEYNYDCMTKNNSIKIMITMKLGYF